MVAEDREISVHRRIGKPEEGYGTTVGVTVETSGRKASVVGALVGTKSRVIRIDDYQVDVPPAGNLLILKNQDVPGVIGRVGTVLGVGDVNIGFFHESRLDRAGAEALAAVAVDQAPSKALLAELEALPEVLEVSLVSLGGG
jgi:hypothetical protein